MGDLGSIREWLSGVFGAMRASRVTISLFVGFFLCVGVRADIMLESPVDFEVQPLMCAYTDLACVRTDTLLEPPVNVADQPVYT